jgi:DNA polymerase III epsilon subunit-like protein
MAGKRSEVYISVDVEASGPIPGEFSLLSIGACVVGQTNLTFYAELKPLNENFVKVALDVSQLSLEQLKVSGEHPAEAMSRFERWILSVSKDERPVFVAFNGTFDWMFTHWYFVKFLRRDPFGISGLDIKAYYMGLTRAHWSETTKKHIRAAFLPGSRHTHEALEDAIEQAEIFAKLLKRS